MAELADARDLKSRGTRVPYRFKPGFRHQNKREASCLPFILRFRKDGAEPLRTQRGASAPIKTHSKTKLSAQMRVLSPVSTSASLRVLRPVSPPPSSLFTLHSSLFTQKGSRHMSRAFFIYSLSIFSNIGHSPSSCARSTAALLVTVQINFGVL